MLNKEAPLFNKFEYEEFKYNDWNQKKGNLYIFLQKIYIWKGRGGGMPQWSVLLTQYRAALSSNPAPQCNPWEES